MVEVVVVEVAVEESVVVCDFCDNCGGGGDYW